MSNKKNLVAFYSFSGNTKAVAEKIQKQLDCDIFEIKTVKEYPNSYNEVVNEAKEEKMKNILPELVENGDVSSYDTIFIGTPVWWYTMAPAVKSFIANNDFGGKTIAPFCTHGGGGASETYSDMQKLAPSASVETGFTSYEDSAADADVSQWLKNLKIN